MTRLTVSQQAQEKTGILSSLYDLFSRPYLNGLLATEISSFSRYYDRIIQIKQRPDDSNALLVDLEAPVKKKVDSLQDLPDFSHEKEGRTVILLNGNFNHHYDVEGLLRDLKTKMSRSSRVCVVVYNSYLRGFYTLANKLGIRRGGLPTTYLTHSALENLCELSGFSIVRSRPVGYIPFELFGVGTLLNRILQATPFLRWFGFAGVLVLRPQIASAKNPSLSILIPARNEKGNIEGAITRLSVLNHIDYEVIFVEGHSNDGTWEEIQRVKEKYGSQCKIQAFRQTGKGKSDAVRLGFSHAKMELLTILDADLTMPPELLPRFYEAYVSGKADFINGSRLVYPMEGEAMRFLNWLGNVFFAKALSWVLDTRIGDSLCGTKLVSKRDYDRFVAWRRDFGDFDPFGDFELLFPAATLGLGIVDIPIRYLARTYGSTSISRFRHGFMLLKMTLTGFFRIRMG